MTDTTRFPSTFLLFRRPSPLVSGKQERNFTPNAVIMEILSRSVASQLGFNLTRPLRCFLCLRLTHRHVPQYHSELRGTLMKEIRRFAYDGSTHSAARAKEPHEDFPEITHPENNHVRHDGIDNLC